MRAPVLMLAAAAGLGAGVLGFHLGGGFAALAPPRTPVESAPAARVIGEPRASFSLPDAEGRVRGVAEWDGKVLVLNFWATWCAPCRDEVPALIAMQRRHAGAGLQVLGIAVDRVEAVREFAAELGINYPSLFAELEALELGRLYGNVHGALPYTAVVDRSGVVRYTHLGPVEAADLERTVAGLLTSPARPAGAR